MSEHPVQNNQLRAGWQAEFWRLTARCHCTRMECLKAKLLARQLAKPLNIRRLQAAALPQMSTTIGQSVVCSTPALTPRSIGGSAERAAGWRGTPICYFW
ncbi:uncharacterized protein CIMG_13096 [Coccidioides immitis RS]|uniref:Uncharacterized protein n=1 Tax=Coccidioides immitis (strain RS) TaxID=246410 RepID=A0A0D8JTJ4_COCIM|nr:uncharacterized protein CIMG_13096 [Coccidioides immitis RS]KJF60645.1 hypothetical protein CIMG_13096 [Coccidioides immitis RS]